MRGVPGVCDSAGSSGLQWHSGMHSTVGDRDPFGGVLFTKLAYSTQHSPLKRKSSSSTDSPSAFTNFFLRNSILPPSHKMVLVPVGNINCISLGLENTCQGMERQTVSHELLYSLRLRLPSEAEERCWQWFGSASSAAGLQQALLPQLELHMSPQT